MTITRELYQHCERAAKRHALDYQTIALMLEWAATEPGPVDVEWFDDSIIPAGKDWQELADVEARLAA